MRSAVELDAALSSYSTRLHAKWETRLGGLLLLLAADAGKDVFEVGLCVLALLLEVLSMQTGSK